MKAEIYARVSTEDQAENGTSLEVQELNCMKKARELGASIVRTYRDEGVSGAYYVTRQEIQRALEDLESGVADTLIVYSISRLSRDVEHQQTIRKRIAKVGARLIICDMPIEDSEEGELMFGMFGSFAQYERKLIRKRTMSGRRRQAEQGLMPCRSNNPYGYQIVTKAKAAVDRYPGRGPDEYVIVEEQARWVREMYKCYAKGMSLKKLAQHLQSLGVDTPRVGKQWLETTLKHILENTTYKGVAVFGKRESRYDESRALVGKKSMYMVFATEERWVTMNVPAIIDEDLWELCQVRLHDNRVKLGGKWKRKFMLTQLLVCPVCGKAMAERRDGKDLKYSSYMCKAFAPSCTS